MRKDLHIIRRSAQRVAEAADRVLDDVVSGQLQQEPAITDRMLGRIAQAMDGFEVRGIRWRAMTLTDRGPKSQERQYGADFLGVLDVELPGITFKKGFLAQAKSLKSAARMPSADFHRMTEQCHTMLRHSPDSFIFIYGPEGIKIVPANAVRGLSEALNPLSLYNRSTQRFFEEFFECFFGDPRLHTAKVSTLDGLAAAAAETDSRNALLLQARKLTDGQ